MNTKVSATATIERKHTTESSFARLTRPYLAHPTSTRQADLPPPCPLTNDLVTTLREADSRYIPSPRPSDPDSRTEVLFLTKGELDKAELCASERVWEEGRCRDGDLVGRRSTEVKDELMRDPGLCWLYEANVTFVDCSTNTSNKERYIATRNVDGTLYHNPHTDRDVINRSFFPLPDQIYPPLDIFESDMLFQQYIAMDEFDLSDSLDSLYRCYSTDHPQFQKRFKELVVTIKESPKIMNQLFHSRHFITIVVYIHENEPESISLLQSFLVKEGRGKFQHRDALADEIGAIMLRTHPAFLEHSHLPVVENMCFVENARDMPIAKSLNLTGMSRDRYCVLEICGIQDRDVYHCKPSYMYGKPGLLVSTDRSRELHNDGNGKVENIRGKQFKILRVFRAEEETKRSDKKKGGEKTKKGEKTKVDK